jgi:hypothetical protein
MYDREDRLFALAKPRAILAQSFKQLIGVEQADRTQDAQEARGFADDRREKRYDRGDVRPCGRM